MPASRAIMVDIEKLNLNPRKRHRFTSASGHLKSGATAKTAVEVVEPVKEAAPVVASPPPPKKSVAPPPPPPPVEEPVKVETEVSVAPEPSDEPQMVTAVGAPEGQVESSEQSSDEKPKKRGKKASTD